MNINLWNQSYPLGMLAMMECIRREFRREENLLLQQASVLGKL